MSASGALDAVIEVYETKIGPHNGARVVAKAWSDPAFKRALLADASKAVSALKLPEDTCIRVWDSTAETRFIVLPMRPAGTEGWSDEKLATLVTRDSI